MLALETGEPADLLKGGLALLEDLRQDATPVLRWYRTRTAGIVLGRGQPEPPAAAGQGLPVLRRFSGGGAVLLDGDVLSLDVLVPTGHPWLQGDMSTVFVRVGSAWAEALGDLGIPGLTVHRGASQARRRGSDRDRLLAAVCYATMGRGEVAAAGRKVVGLAQRRRRHGALVQCGLLRRWRPGRLLTALGADPDDPEVAAAAVGLDELSAQPLPDGMVMAAVQRRMEAAVAG